VLMYRRGLPATSDLSFGYGGESVGLLLGVWRGSVGSCGS
jgi:hypothetical protein